MKKRVLVLEPYYGGSHKQFLNGLCSVIDADFIYLTLPARKWKMRMQLSAPWFVDCIKKTTNKYYDTVLCSTFVDVAVLKALLTGVEGWNSQCSFCTYFHENQFVYPSRVNDTTQQLFSGINYTSALVSDRIAFNSHFNWQTFSHHSKKYLKRAADMDFLDSFQEIEKKTTILYPGIDCCEVEGVKNKRNPVPVICWNHRWEHDKDPETFFNALYRLEDNGYNFHLVVLGQSFQHVPNCFIEAEERLKEKILHFGFVESREEYLLWLGKSDIVVSTAQHEFFGISIIEAVQCGCLPLVPDRLSYPELYSSTCRYSDGNLIEGLIDHLQNYQNREKILRDLDTKKFHWNVLKKDYYEWLFHEKYNS